MQQLEQLTSSVDESSYVIQHLLRELALGRLQVRCCAALCAQARASARCVRLAQLHLSHTRFRSDAFQSCHQPPDCRAALRHQSDTRARLDAVGSALEREIGALELEFTQRGGDGSGRASATMRASHQTAAERRREWRAPAPRAVSPAAGAVPVLQLPRADERWAADRSDALPPRQQSPPVVVPNLMLQFLGTNRDGVRQCGVSTAGSIRMQLLRAESDTRLDAAHKRRDTSVQRTAPRRAAPRTAPAPAPSSTVGINSARPLDAMTLLWRECA